MSKTLYISSKNLPVRPIVPLTLALLAFLKAFNVSQIVWAVVITLLVIVWISLTTLVCMTDTVELDMEKLARDYKKEG